MKKLFTLVLTLSAALASAQFATAQGPERGDRPQRPFGDFMAAARTDDGRIDLSKLPDQIPQERKDAFKAADKDNDGFLTREELSAMPRPKFQFREGEKPDFLNDDNAFIVDKAIEAIKAADKNKDGIIDEEEQRAAANVVREKSPMFPRFIALLFGDMQGRFGAPNGGFGPGMMGQGRPQGDRPQGRAGQRPQGDRPQGARPQNRRAPREGGQN